MTDDKTMIFDSSMLDEDRQPKTIGKYRVDSVLGQGAMGIVYKAFDPHIQREVAIKLIHKDLMAPEAGDEVSTRFRLEAQAAGRFSPHNNIVTVYEYGEENGQPYIVMEFVKGKTLKQWLQGNTRFSLPNTYSIMGQLLTALQYSHSHKVVHRDIKPDNIFLLDNGQVKITDFGVAKIDQTSVTQRDIRIGTPNYMSPEQIEGKPVDGRSDLFSAGVIFYEMLTGMKPFSGDSMASLLHKVVNTDPIAVSIACQQVPRVFDGVVEKALAKNPENRFQSGHDFANAIKDALEGRDTAPFRAILSNRKLMALGGSGLLGLFLIVAGIVWMFSHTEEPRREESQQSQKSAVAMLRPESGRETAVPSPPVASLPAAKVEAETPQAGHPSAAIQDAVPRQPVVPPAQVAEITPPSSSPMPATAAPASEAGLAAKLRPFEARIFYTSASAMMNELRDGDTLTPSDNYYITYQPNSEQYFYAFQIDSSGGVYSIFPNKEFSKNSNPLAPGREYKIPEERNLFLDFNVGKEKIYFISSEKKIAQVEQLFEELQSADDAIRKKMAKKFVDIFESQDAGSTSSIWFWHK